MSDNVDQPPPLVPDKPKKRQPGGAWRAFLRERLWRCNIAKPFKTLMPSLKAAYRALNPEQRAEAQMAGRAGTVAGRAKVTFCESSFGMRSKEVDALRQREFRKSLHGRVKAIHDSVTASAALSDIQQQAGSLDYGAQVARIARCEETQTKLDELREDAQQLVNYEDDAGKLAIAMHAEWLPGTEHHDWVAVPTEHGHAFSVNAVSQSSTDCASLVADWNLHYGIDKTPANADSAWKAINRPLMNKACGAEAEEKPEKDACNKAGMCLCTPVGREIVRFGESFQDVCMKPLARAHSEGRVSLKRGNWAFRFTGSPMAKYADDPLEELESWDRQEIILHVASMCLSPWLPGWQVLGRSEAPVGDPPATDIRIYTEANRYLTIVETTLI